MNIKPRTTTTFRTETEWKSLIDDWLASGKSSSVFAREMKVAESGLYNWRKRFYPNIKKTKHKVEKKKPDLFVPVMLTNTIGSSPNITLTYPNGCQLQITSINLGVLEMLNQAMGVV